MNDEARIFYKTRTEEMIKVSKAPSSLKAGRPSGTPNPTPLDKIKRDFPKMLEALRVRALTGDPAAVKLCAELTKR